MDKSLFAKKEAMRGRAEAAMEEKKKEVISGLKNLADGFLGYFGMSTNDFKVEQGANGSYSIGMKK
jgi:hypothetical protein